MKNKVWNILNITIKILLCISLIVAASLLVNYVKNINPTMDCFSVTNFVARLIHGDDYWTWEKLTNGLYSSFAIFVVLFCIDKILNIISSKKK